MSHTTSSPTPHPLSALRVLDLSREYAGALCAMHLADHGATVLTTSPLPHPRFTRRNKYLLADHPATSLATLKALALRADVVIEDRAHPLMRDVLQDPSLGIVHVWLPPFPADHPLASSSAPVGALEAYMGLQQHPLLPRPAAHSLPLIDVTAAATAACAITAALIARQRDRRGQRLTLPRADLAYPLLELNAMFTLSPPKQWATLQWAASPFIASYPAQDAAYLYLHAGLPHHLERLLDTLHILEPQLTQELKNQLSPQTFHDPTSVPSALEARQVRRALAALFATRAAPEWEALLSEAGLCAVVVQTPEQWLNHPHPRAEGQLVELEGRLVPGTIARYDLESPALLAARACSEEEALKLFPARDVARPDEQPPPDTRAPLDGVSVLDLTQVIAGPTATRLLAQLGARVHRIENPHFKAPWVDAFHVAFNAGKSAELLDLKLSEERDTLLAQLAQAPPDLVALNLRPGAAAPLGLDEAALRTIAPEHIYMHLTAYGESGPWGERPGWEQTAQAATGIQHTWGGEGPPSLFPMPINDLCTGLHGAFVALTALFARRDGRSGPRRVGTSLSYTATLMQALHLCEEQPLARGPGSLGAHPLRRFYKLADQWAFLAMDDARALARLPGLRALRGASGEALVLSLESALATRSYASWRGEILEARQEAHITLLPMRSQRTVLRDVRAYKLGLVHVAHYPHLQAVHQTSLRLDFEQTPCVKLGPAPHVERARRELSLPQWAKLQLHGAASLGLMRLAARQGSE